MTGRADRTVPRKVCCNLFGERLLLLSCLLFLDLFADLVQFLLDLRHEDPQLRLSGGPFVHSQRVEPDHLATDLHAPPASPHGAGEVPAPAVDLAAVEARENAAPLPIDTAPVSAPAPRKPRKRKIVTPTEAALIAVVYSLILGVAIYRTIPLKGISPLLLKTAKLAA